MQYATPQFIESESKIISFLTFKQFFWLVGAGALCIAWYYLLPFFLFAILSLVTVAIVGTIAFIKVDNASVLTLLLNFLGFSMGTKNYTWKKKAAVYPFKLQKKPELKRLQTAPNAVPIKMAASKLNDIKKLIDTKR